MTGHVPTAGSPASPPKCQRCSAYLQMPGQPCATCGLIPGQLPAPAPFYPQQPPKSAIIAVVLSFLWLGAGQLYTGRLIPLGVALMVWDGILFLFALTGLGLIIAIPLWIVTFIPAAVVAGVTANAANRPQQTRY